MQGWMSQMLAKSLGAEGAQQATCRRTLAFPLSELLQPSCRTAPAAQIQALSGPCSHLWRHMYACPSGLAHSCHPCRMPLSPHLCRSGVAAVSLHAAAVQVHSARRCAAVRLQHSQRSAAV